MKSDVGIQVLAGEQVAEVLPGTQYAAQQAIAWLVATMNAAEGRDFFGKVTLELTYQAGQITTVKPILAQTIQY